MENVPATSKNAALAKIHIRSALSFGGYGRFVVSGWVSSVDGLPIDEEMREHARRCVRWSYVVVLIFFLLFGMVGGAVVFVVLMTGILPRSYVGAAFICYQILVGNLALVVLWIYARRAQRYLLAGKDFKYPCANFRVGIGGY